MHTLRIDSYTSAHNVTLTNVAMPVPGPADVIVRIAAAAVNPLDVKLLSGQMDAIFPLQFPYTPGADIAGIVDAIGPLVKGVKTGDRVIGRLNPLVGGGFAEYVRIPVNAISPMPDNLDMSVAAAIPTAGSTAWLALFNIAGLQRGQKILIHAASGGVGTFAVQLAKLAGAYVIATTSRENVARVQALGADEVIDYMHADFTDRVHDVDIVIDPVGGTTEDRSWQVIKPGGMLVSLNNIQIASRGNINAAFTPLTLNPSTVHALALLVAHGQLDVLIDKVFPLSDVSQALQYVATGRTVGKVVIRVTV